MLATQREERGLFRRLVAKWFGRGRTRFATGGGSSSRARLALDGCEDRTVPAFLVTPPKGGLLRVVGTNAGETVNIEVGRSNVTVNGQSFQASKVAVIDIGGKGGNDTINITYAAGSYNPTIRAYGDAGDDKVEVRNGAGKAITAVGGTGYDKLALHGVANLGSGKQVGFEKVWSDVSAAQIASSFYGRNVSELKTSGALPMDPSVANNVCCANFVSAVLQKTGQLPAGQRPIIAVSELAKTLKALGWRPVPLAQARPGDVWIDKAGGRSHTELVFSNDNGRVRLIGANNKNPDGSQRISYDDSSATNSGSYILTPP